MPTSKNSLQKYLLAFIVLILLLVSFNGHMGEDEGRFSYMGRIWTENGLPPYTESIENKTPGIFILNALSFSLFGTNIFFVRFLGICALLTSSLLVYKISRNLHSHEAGLIGMLIFGLSMSWRGMDGSFASLTESFMLLFILFSFYILSNPKNKSSGVLIPFIAGISTGFAIAFKQIAITSTAALFLFLIINYQDYHKKKKLVRDIFLILLGIMIASFVSVIPLLFSNVTIIDYINGSWLILLDDGSSPTLVNRFISARAIWLESRMVFFLPFLIFTFIQPELVKNKYYLALLIWLFFDFLGVNASGYYFGHQIKQLMPSLSIIIGISIANLIRSQSDSLDKKYYTIKQVLFFLLVFLLPFNNLFDNYFRIHDKELHDTNKEIGLYIKNNSNTSDFVYMMTNANAVLSYTDRISATRFFNPLFVNTKHEHNEVLSDIRNKTPKFIVQRIDETHYTFPDEYHQFVQNNYVFKKEINEFRILIHKSALLN